MKLRWGYFARLASHVSAVTTAALLLGGYALAQGPVQYGYAPIPATGNEISRLPAQPTLYNAASEATDGCKLEKVDIQSKPNHKLRGRLYFDNIMYDDTPLLDRLNETGFDTARIGIQGNVFENIKYVIEVEFEGTEVDYKDVFLHYDSLPRLGNVKVGHFKEPISLEELTSSRYITFMERATPKSAFVPGRNFGIMAYDYLGCNEDISWFLGTFRNDTDDSPLGSGMQKQDEGDWVFDARMAWTPYFDEPSNGRYLVHIGGAFSRRRSGTLATFTPKPELGTQGTLLSATTATRSWNLYQVEAAVVWGPGTVHAEYYRVDTDDGLDYSGGFVQASYFLTGENRGYKRLAKAFNRVKPHENVFSVRTCDGICRGRGAWEIATRYSYTDVNAGTVTPGYMDGVTAGINWYLNPYSRMMLNWTHERTLTAAGARTHAQLFGMRWQLDW